MTNEELLRVISEATINKKPYLDLSNCNLKSLPPEIGKMRDLKSLNISDNRLSDLPPEIGQLTNLTYLNISENRLRNLPPEIGKLSNLKILEIVQNKLNNLPPEIGELTNLIRLAISVNKLRILPPEIGKLTNLAGLGISENKLKSLPPEIGELTNLSNLYIMGNYLKSLPPEIGQFRNLTELNIGQNKLRSLPPEIGQLSNLTQLYIPSNQLRSLPPEIGQLSNLTDLNISGNKLTNLPPEIGQLRNLKNFNISRNQLNSLPPEIFQLRNLTQIGQLRINLDLTENYELEQQIKVYVEKWINTAAYTQQGDRASVTEAVKYIYNMRGKKEPEIFFFDNPYQALIELNQMLNDRQEGNKALKPISRNYRQHSSPFSNQLTVMSVNNRERAIGLSTHLSNILLSLQVRESRPEGLPMNLIFNRILPDFWAEWASWFDFCMEVFGSKPHEEWAAYQSLAKYAGWMFPYEDFCVLCDRPVVLRLDSQNRVHAEGEPAIKFADGFSVYAYHGVSLPEEYGKLPSSQWHAEWLLSERNAELRRVLIQGIGYDRICQELQATPLDAWQEYQLLRIDSPIEREPMLLLKMTCPSTGYVHAMRVPPLVRSAREAIKWVNWGIDPSEFSVQT